MSNNMTTRRSGIIQTTAMMPAGMAAAKQAIPKSMGNNTSSLNNPSKLAQTAPQPTTAQEQQAPAIHLVAAVDNTVSSTPMASTLQSVQQEENKVEIMIDSGAATHVCPPWFAPSTPMYTLQHGHVPQLRTATDEAIPVYGYILMTNINKQQLVVLCVRNDATHHVSNKTGRTRVQQTVTVKWDTSSHTHTQRDSTQHRFNVMDFTSWWWSLSTF